MQFGATRKRADLFGQGSPGWVVVESKGRSNSMESDLREKLVAQKRSIVSIDDNPPSLALGCVASFPRGTSGVRIDAFDPDSTEIDHVVIDADLDRYVLAYYEPFIAAIDAGAAISAEELRGNFTVAEFQQFGLRVGLLQSIDQRVRAAIRGELAGLARDVLSIITNQFGDDNSDGTIIETDWEQSLTMNDWEY
jgi:hypothetical protein